jgi:hypothetical protein
MFQPPPSPAARSPNHKLSRTLSPIPSSALPFPAAPSIRPLESETRPMFLQSPRSALGLIGTAFPRDIPLHLPPPIQPPAHISLGTELLAYSRARYHCPSSSLGGQPLLLYNLRSGTRRASTLMPTSTSRWLGEWCSLINLRNYIAPLRC